ncbi:AAA family ATPase [Hallella faecis]|uniref:AAA family ATPase n=1 Tax=Hallella faecis TaxID=2841596 RepID=UPI003F89F6A4
MKLKIRNINKIKTADIKLDGLTVIAGANSSGKSTVGKLLFSMVKSQANAEFLNHQSKEEKLRKRVEELYKRANGCFSRYDDAELAEILPLPISRFIAPLVELADKEEIKRRLGKISSWIESKDISPRIKSLFAQDIDNISIALGDSKAADIASEVRVFTESEFMNKICSYKTKESKAKLEYDNPNSFLSLEFADDLINQVYFEGDDYLSDATYVESPLYLHILDTLLYAATYQEYQTRPMMTFRGMVPIHIKDLANKLHALQMVPSGKESQSEYGLSELMGGRFAFDKDSKVLKFFSERMGMELSPINIASGIKTFGMVQILLETQVIGNDKILIWDEPENHLHPQWQVTFAELLVKLAKRGIPVIISTHSPYFVQGIRYFSAKHDLETFTNYYLAEEEEDSRLSVIHDVKDDLNQIFSKLAAPLNAIMNVDEARRNRN